MRGLLPLFLLSSAVLLLSCREERATAKSLPPSASATVRAPAAPEDTEVYLKPTPQQLAAAIPVRNLHCPTDGEKVGSMGPGVPVVYKGRSVLLCCPNCAKEFAEDPDKYLAVARADTVPDK